MRLTNEELRAFLAGPYKRILGAVTLLTGSRAAAEDAVHEALARAWERREQIDQLERWVSTVAFNLARSRWRKVRREVGGGDHDHRTVAPVDPVSIDLDRALRGLPRREREVAVLHYLLDMRVADIAGLLHLSDGGVKHALFRARRSLAHALAIEEEEEVTP